MIGKRTNERFTYCFPPASLPHYRYADEVGAFAGPLSRGSQFNSPISTPAVAVPVFTLPPVPFSLSATVPLLSPPRFAYSLYTRLCTEIPGCRGLSETFNREWNSRWNVNETQLDYTYTLFPGYSQSFAEIPGCFQRDEIPAWQTQRRFPDPGSPGNHKSEFISRFFPLYSFLFLCRSLFCRSV